MKNEITKNYENGILTLTTSNRQKAWAAEITGKSVKYTFERKFVERCDCGPGWAQFKLEEGKIYCWYEYDQQYGTVEDGKLYEISKSDALEMIKA